MLGATVENSATRATKGWDTCSNSVYNCYENSYKTQFISSDILTAIQNTYSWPSTFTSVSG